MAAISLWTVCILVHLAILQSWVGAVTDFCSQPLGMKTRIIANDQITQSSYVPNYEPRRGYNARLDHTECWCADQSQPRIGQWVKVDLKHTFSVTGITIQGDPSSASNYIKEFNLRYSVDLTNYVYVTTTTYNDPMKFTGATGPNQKIDVMFPNRTFSARYLEFKPTDSNGDYLCVRFELYGCLYVCGQGLGIEHGSELPSGFAMTSSSHSSGQEVAPGRLNNPSAAWCDSGTTNQFLQVDFGKIVTVSGIATQGNPSAASWVKDFYVEYGTTLSSLVTYQENTGNKLFIGNSDQNTIVVNWFRVRLQTRYVKIKPNTYNSGVCMRIEILGCNLDSVYEFGAENRALPDNRFSAYATTDFFNNGRYQPKDGRLNNDRPWGCSRTETSFLWFKVDLGRDMLVTAIATQGDRTYGPNYFPDFKLQYTRGSNNITIKEESSSTEKVFIGNTNNAGVKFNLFEKPVSARYIQFIKNSNLLWDNTLTLEVYGRPPICSSSFGMEAGEPNTNNPTVSASSGIVPDKRSKLNTPNSWCATTSDTNQFFQYDFGMAKVISGFAIQGDPVFEKWVETFKVQFGDDVSSLSTYQEGGSDKIFTGCKSREGIVYHWFSSSLKIRYLRIVPLTWKTAICLRMNAYGCPDSECRDTVGIQSSSSVSDASMTSSTSANGNGAHKGRFNVESVWEACQFGSCFPKESTGAKPWIQACLPSVQSISSIVIQGQGNVDNLAKVTEFSLKYSYSTIASGTFFEYKHSNLLQKFAGADGRYSSSQIDLPHTIIARCIRLQVETQSPTNQNVGLRWEMLGCASVGQVSSISIVPSSPSLARDGEVTLTCTVAAQPGVEAAWKNGSNTLTSTGIYQVGNNAVTNENINGETTKTLKITATPYTVANSFTSCTVTDSAQGLVQCKHTFGCSAMYPGISSTSKSGTVEVTVTGLLAKPSTPSGMATSSLTNTTASVTWNASVSDFPTESYNVILKKKSDGSTQETQNNLKTTAASFTGLSAYTDYTIEVSAKSSPLNINSDTGTLDFKTEEGVSSSPSAVSSAALSSTSIQVSWSQPSSLNGVLHDYKVRYKMTSAADFTTPVSAGSNLTKTISSLKPFKDYQAQVLATTKGGTILGIWSSAATAKTHEGRPTQPQDLKFANIQSTSALVNFTKPAEENGIVTNYTLRYRGSKSYNNSFEHVNSTTIDREPSSDFTEAVLTSLVPATEYSIDVAATTGGGQGEFSSSLTFRTAFAGPPKPSLESLGRVNTVLKVNAGATWDINGPVSEYQLSFVEGKAMSCQPSGSAETFLPSKLPLQLEFQPGIKSVTHISTELKTLANYTICYRAATTDKGQKYFSQFSSVTIERTYLEKMDVNVYKSNATATSFVIPLAQGPSNAKSYHIIVIERNSTSQVKHPENFSPSDLGPYDSSTYVPGKAYVTGVLSSFTSKFEIGDGKEYSVSTRRRRNVGGQKYTNVPLKENTAYMVFQRAYVSQNIYFSSPWIGPFQTNKVSPTKVPRIATTDPSPSVGLIVGIIVPILIIIALVAAVLYIRKRRLGSPKHTENGIPEKKFVPLPELAGMQSNPSFEDEDETTNVETPPAPTHPHSMLRRHSSGASLKHRKAPRAVGNDKRHPPISVQDFIGHFKELQKDSHHGITSEFEDLDKGQLYTWDVATNATNKPKNRYANIAAYDHSRVHLKPLPGVNHSDYFNASHILGYSGKQKYLASQGPTDVVLYDFWRMVWDKNVQAIVMLTNVVERGKKKCSQYWPDFGSETYGKVTVSLISIQNYVDYAIRCFSVKREGCKDERTVYQYHFLTWPDYGIPESPTDLLNLRAKFRRQFPYNMEDPVVVHCSAGVGRTGTFILIDTMLELVQTQRKVDIFNYLNFIRSQRIHLVQVEEQYIFIYNALVEAITCGKTEIEAQNLRIQINQLQSKDGSGKTGFEQQFERLLLTTTYFTETEASIGCQGHNKQRNRREDVLPKDINRVILQQSIYENDGASEYINATYVNGYRKKNAFIATQHPLPETIDDFWLMIQQTEAPIVVLLNRLNDGRESLPIFWPSPQQTAEYGKVLVYHQSESNGPDFVERQFSVSHDNSRDACKNVTIFHFQSWPDHSVPKDFSKLLSLISNIEKCQQQQSDDQPIVIMCRDGAGRTGTFIAISNILERFKIEQLVDVFQTIKKTRAFRPQFVENAAQYKFCHTITQAFIDSFDTYANFSG
ncbi:receptor-type tyrosine-protein phosphatase S-like isoform X1 [Rhopilema esculentum]|uniref:receptor-type tyrosine-protein phosphatase S-like isoform X1 n=1 Tax=Rhopilema esculentum TaxID=499914 RepID=UPI0031D43413